MNKNLKNILSNDIIDKINLNLDNYFIEPYQYINKNSINYKNDEISDIINSLNNIVNNTQINKSNITENFNPILFKLIANDQNDELEKTIKNNNKININIQDKDGDTPLHISVFLCNISSTKILLDNNADPKLKDKWGQTPLHRLCFCINEINCINIINIFNKKYSKKNMKNDYINLFNLVDNFGNTPTHLLLKHIIKNNIIINKNNIKLIQKVKLLTNKSIKNDNNQTIIDLILIIKEKNGITNL